jgi:hypothetical protein
MSVVHTGSTQQFSDNWTTAFGKKTKGKKAVKKKSPKKSPKKSAKKSPKKTTAAKKKKQAAKKSTKKKAPAKKKPGTKKPVTKKPAKLETGLTIQVPEYLKQGETIKVDTRNGDFLGRA